MKSDSVALSLNVPQEDLDYIVGSVGSRWEHLRNQRLLLTGGTGFIGKWMLSTFLEANNKYNLSAKIVVLSRQPELFLNEHPLLREFREIDWLEGDVRSFLIDDVSDCNFIIHAATDVIASSARSEIFDVCDLGTRRVLEGASLTNSNKRLLLLSSGAVYGRTPSDLIEIPETWYGAPESLSALSAYGEGKRVSELLCAFAAKENPQFEFSVARCFSFVGPHLSLNKQFAIGNFIYSALLNKNINIRGDGAPMRSYLYAAEMSHWLWVMLFDSKNGAVYNVGGEEKISIRELAGRVNNVLCGKGKVIIKESINPEASPDYYVPSICLIKSELGLGSSIKLDESIYRTAKWAQRQL